MRTEAIIVFVLAAATPAYASKTCMTMAEARQQYATTHLYWHGAGHCWDMTPPRHRVVRVKPREDQQARRDNREPVPQEPKWRNAMSEMLPADVSPETLSAPSPPPPDETPPMNWPDRWVDIAQVTLPATFIRKDEPPEILAAVRNSDNGYFAITPLRLILMFLVAALAMIALLSRNLLHDWRGTLSG
jgi:hypothetical protein